MVLQRAGWRVKELGGGGWSWVKVGAQFSNTYSQLIDQTTHITKESSSCIDLIFTSNPSFISASGVELSLYEKCHHNLIYGKINFNVPLPPPYIREV